MIAEEAKHSYLERASFKLNKDMKLKKEIVVEMSMDDYGTEVWAEMTEKCVQDNNRAVAVVLDNLVYSAPVVRSSITNGRSEITLGSNKPKATQVLEAEDLAGLLKAGSLPAPATIVDEVIVGPQLGQKNIDRGLMSFLIALVVVLLYMIFYYKGAGSSIQRSAYCKPILPCRRTCSTWRSTYSSWNCRYRTYYRYGGRR